MAIYWPDTLPQKFEVSGFGTVLKEGRLKTDMDAGPPKVRRRTSGVSRSINGMFPTDSNGYAQLLRFYEEDLEGGVLPFILPDQLLDGEMELDENGDPVLDEDDIPVLIDAYWLVQFNSPPQVAAISTRIYSISMALRIMP